MKIKRVLVSDDSSTSVAVWHNEQWLPLLPVMKSAIGGFSEEELLMGSDLMAFLQAGYDKQQALIEKADKQLNSFAAMNWDILDKSVLPFCPKSYRDFMLFERHVIQASRGFLRQFKPGAYNVISFYEKITGKTFSKFKPSPLWYENPIYYMGNHLSFVENGHPVAFPSYCSALDYELELGAIIVRPLKNANPETALKAVGGFVVFNDFSARNVQLAEMRSGFGPVKAKNFMNSISDVVVTADQILPHLSDLKGDVYINGKLVSSSSTSEMYHGLGTAISYASLEEQLYPGEFIATGTLPGGCAMENGYWLKPGDNITLSIDRIGTLSNPIVKK